MSTLINIDQIIPSYFSIDSTISRDHIFSSWRIDAPLDASQARKAEDADDASKR